MKYTEFTSGKIEVRCSVIRREFEEAKTISYTRQIIDAAKGITPTDFWTDLVLDYEGEYGLEYKSPESHTNYKEKFTYEPRSEHDEGATGYFCWPSDWGKTFGDVLKNVGWCYYAPESLFVDHDSLDTAATEGDFQYVKHHDPRTVPGMDNRIFTQWQQVEFFNY